MAIPQHHLGMRGDECQCGRRASLIHCIACGSSRVYARHNRYHEFLKTNENGESYKEPHLVPTEFRCQSCDFLFVPEEREYCEAPAVGEKLQRQRIAALALAQQQGEYLRPKDAKAASAIRDLLKTPTSTSEGAAAMTYAEFRRIEHQLIGVYRDELVELRNTGKTHDKTEREFVDAYLSQMGIQRIEPATSSAIAESEAAPKEE